MCTRIVIDIIIIKLLKIHPTLVTTTAYNHTHYHYYFVIFEVGWLGFNGSFSTKRVFGAIMSYNLLYKQISFIYCSIEEG